MVAIIATIGALAVGVFGRLLGEDLRSWVQWAPSRLLERALRKLPENERERFREEFHADLASWPGDISKLLRAIGFLHACRSMGQTTAAGVLPIERLIRVLDIVLSMFMLLLLWPTLILCSALVVCGGAKSLLVGEPRVGLGGKTFISLRFRTRGGQSGPEDKFLIAGRLLQRTSLNELPQLLNVIKGDMGLIKRPGTRDVA